MIKRIKEFLFRNQNVRQTVAKNTFWLTFSNIGGRFLRSFVLIYSARILGATEWGVFAYALSLVAFVSIFIDIGISSILVREFVKHHDNPVWQQEVLSTSFYLKLALLFLGILMVIFIAPHFTKISGVKLILPIAAFILAFDTFREFGSSLIRVIEKMEWEAFIYLLTNAGIVAFGFIFLHLSQTVASLTYGYATGAGIGFIATIIVLRKKLEGIFSHFSLKMMKFILKGAWPFAIAGALGILMLNADILIIGWMKSTADVGLYSAAQRIIQLIYILPAILSLAILPAFSRFAYGNKEKLKKMLELVLHFAFLFAFPIAIGGFLFGKEIVVFFFGEPYALGAASFSILAITILIDFPASILSNIVFVYNKQKSLTVYAAIGGVSNILLDLLLIPPLGITGSAIATLCAQFMSNMYLRHIVKKEVDFRVSSRLKRVFVATALMALICLALNLAHFHIVIVIGAGIAVYGGALLLLKEPILKEIKLILQPNTSKTLPIV